MTIYRGLSILFVLFCLSAKAQKAEISGIAKEWSGKEIRLLIENDPITKTFRQVDSDTIVSDGSFKLTVDTSETALYWLAVKRFKSPIWISPATVYPISIIPKPENILVDTWQNGSFEYAFLALDAVDVNKMLADFDTKYYDFYLDNSRFIGTSQLKRKVAAYAEEQKTDSANAFIHTYQIYTFAEMKLSSGFKKSDLFEEYLNDKPIELQNIAWFDFFNLFYADYFQTYDLKFGGATIANRLKTGLPPDSLSILFKQDDFLQNDTIRQLVILKSISESYSNPAYPLDKLIAIVNLIGETPASTEVGAIANRLKAKMENTLIDSNLATISKNWKPGYIAEQDTLPTILMVTTEGSTASEKEALVLKSLFEKYEGIAHFAEVRISDGSKPATRPWKVYYPQNQMQFLDHFNIYGFPHFIWVDGNGTIRENGIEKPSEGLESRLFKVQTETDNRNRIKVGQ
ncbi:hypothetical protein G3O08_02720 [Cryomorpha ignava]|uniref:TlpA family protein disulfide reductase n=1 Tax=Cryomorpha ignava TaxID=101383 RepID=A0A7K3WLS7_9FLAO|nr:hypothetical protein [Cryomorpha ignava]NEN22414.1 hypothetical protein [Cryomorpha ignava]